MKKSLILFFFILLFLQLQQDLALGDLHSLENQAASFHLGAQELQGTENVHMHDEEDGGEHSKTEYHTIGSEKAQRGRGSNGGANINHKGPKSNSAVPILKRTIGFVSTTNVCISLSLLLVLPLIVG